ncbi:MAG: proline--tRNA ligase [Phycisphaerae bacterium]|nr:proline--tRNA ligase [Phycisphaerae bacterium]
MKWRKYFIPTTKETPKDATAASHILLLRAGLARQLAAGIYSYLPLGLRALRKAENIVREEMDRAGAVELRMPCLTPTTLWEETGRLETMSDILLRIDGSVGDWATGLVLGPTHEEIITDIARAYLKSYKQLPINLYQIQLKFRGEARPKSGVLRTREFLMKDAYSFHHDLETLDKEYENMYATYCRIFKRCGLPYTVVEAESGAMGGDVSHEFMVMTDAGEDLVAISEDRVYAANLERAAAAPPEAGQDDDTFAELEEVHTPGAGRVEDVCAVLGTQPRQMIKTLIYTGVAPASSRFDSDVAPASSRSEAVRVVALVRGDHEINEFKLAKAAGMMLELADPETIEEVTGALVGFAGPQGLVDKIDKLIIDREVTVLRDAASGANKTDYHVTGVNPGRDFPLDSAGTGPGRYGEKVVVADIRNVVDGDPAPIESRSPLHLRTAIEVGHIFMLGTKYSDSMGATCLDKNGRARPLIMGCYGIGVNRIMAAAIESHHDENGIIWPMSLAPFEVLVIALDSKDERANKVALEVHDELAAAGIDVLLDDRDERAGFKFKDADLIGIPLRVVVGKKSLAAGGVEVTERGKESKEIMPPEAAVEHVTKLVRQELNKLAQ